MTPDRIAKLEEAVRKLARLVMWTITESDSARLHRGAMKHTESRDNYDEAAAIAVELSKGEE